MYADDPHRRTHSRRRAFLLAAALSALLAGCASRDPELAGAEFGSKFLIADWDLRAPSTAAALPILNETLDLDAPEIFRPYVHQALYGKGYSGPTPEEIDALLLTKDIREAGQVNSLTSAELGELLGVDAIVYSTVLDWSTTYLGVYASITVSARFEMVEAATGTRLWVDEDTQVERVVANVFNQRRLAEEAAKVAAYAALRAYEPFAERVVMNSFQSLPHARYRP